MIGSYPRAIPDTLEQYVEHFRARVLQDALNEATASYWIGRAEAFEAARPRPGDFTGNATRDDLREQWNRLTETANACRARARVSLLVDLAPEVRDVLREVA